MKTIFEKTLSKVPLPVKTAAHKFDYVLCKYSILVPPPF